MNRRNDLDKYKSKPRLSTWETHKEDHAVIFGYFQGLIKSLTSSDSKTMNSLLSELYSKLHGTDDTYDNLSNMVTRENLTPIIQQLFDLVKKGMGRDMDDDFTVDTPTAVVFCHELLNNEHPDMTFTNYSEHDARGIVDRGESGMLSIAEMEQNAMDVGGKKRKSKRRRHTSRRRRHTSRKRRRHTSRKRRH